MNSVAAGPPGRLGAAGAIGGGTYAGAGGDAGTGAGGGGNETGAGIGSGSLGEDTLSAAGAGEPGARGATGAVRRGRDRLSSRSIAAMRDKAAPGRATPPHTLLWCWQDADVPEMYVLWR
jgi:hypothetical protein